MLICFSYCHFIPLFYHPSGKFNVSERVCSFMFSVLKKLREKGDRNRYLKISWGDMLKFKDPICHLCWGWSCKVMSAWHFRVTNWLSFISLWHNCTAILLPLSPPQIFSLTANPLGHFSFPKSTKITMTLLCFIYMLYVYTYTQLHIQTIMQLLIIKCY